MNIKVIDINPRDILLLEQNAHYMTHEEFSQLVANVRKDGQLSSAPFLCLEHTGECAGRYRCLSGNHRVKAAIEVGIPLIHCLGTDDPLNEQERIASQIAHNAIHGRDDPATLKALYEKIIDTELKKYSGLDDKTLQLLEKVSVMSISEANLKFQTLSMVFLPDELEAAQRVMGEALERVNHSHAVWIARMSQYDSWLDAQELTSSSHNVKNVATAVDLILRQFERNLDQLAEPWLESDDDSRWVPVESVIGRGKIPAGSAKVIRQALERMVGAGELTSKNLWQGLEYLAAEYLGKR